MIRRLEMAMHIEINKYESQFLAQKHDDAVERNEKRLAWMQEHNAQFEKELNDALNEGYQIVAQYQTAPSPVAYQGFILHKPDATPDK